MSVRIEAADVFLRDAPSRVFIDFFQVQHRSSSPVSSPLFRLQLDAVICIAWTFVNISSKSPEVQGKLCGATVVFRIPLSRYRKFQIKIYIGS